MKKLFATVGAAAILAASPASGASWVVSGGPDTSVAANNDYKGALEDLGYTGASIGADVSISTGAWVEFFFMGSESGFMDSFKVTGANGDVLTFTEDNSTAWPWQFNPVYLGTVWVEGALDVLFTNDGGNLGRNASSGTAGFAVFTGANTASNELFFGYDDEAGFQDDDHDDMIFRARILPVPEPTTWAMMLGGIAAVGFAMRRRPATTRVSFS
jgi:hypothetical protein